MKYPLIIAAVAVAVGAVAPKIVGGKVDQQLNDVVAAINKQPTYTAELVNVQQGWFSTQAGIKVGIDLQSMMAGIPQEPEAPELSEELSIILAFEADHGPFLEKSGLGWVDWQLSFAGDQVREDIQWNANKPLYELTASTNLLMKTAVEDRIQAFTFETEENYDKGEFSGYQGSGELKGDTFEYAGKADFLKGHDSEISIGINDIAVKFDSMGDYLAALQGHLYDSFTEVSVASIKVNAIADDTKVEINNLAVSGDVNVSEDQQLADMLVKYAIGEILVDDNVSRDLMLQAEVKNIKTEFFKQYQQLMQDMFEQAGTGDEEQIAQLFQTFLQEQVMDLLDAGPQMSFAFSSGLLDFNVPQKDEKVQVEGLSFGSGFAIDADTQLARWGLDYKVGKLAMEGIDTQDVEISAELKNIATNVFDQLNKFIEDSKGKDDAQVAMLKDQYVNETIMSVLKSGPELNITKMKATTNDGTLDASMNSKLVNVDALPANMQDPSFWLNHIQSNVDAKADQAFATLAASAFMKYQIAGDPAAAELTQEQIDGIAAQQAPMMLQNLQQQGMVKLVEDTYELSLEIKDGQANLNGNVIPLGAGG